MSILFLEQCGPPIPCWFNMELIEKFLAGLAQTIHISLEKFSLEVFVGTEDHFDDNGLIPAPTLNKYIFSYLSKCPNLRVLELDIDGVSDPSEVFKAQRFKFTKLEELNIKLRENVPKMAIFKKTVEKLTKNMPKLKNLTLAFGKNEDYDDDEDEDEDADEDADEDEDDDDYHKHRVFCQKISAKKNIMVEVESNPGWD